MNAPENWKVVPGFPEYEASDLGRIRRCVTRGPAKAGRLLKAHMSRRKPYLIVGLFRDGKRHPFTVHRVVMDTFVGPLPEGFDRSHKDGDPTNNALSNLAFESKSQNNNRKVAHGTAQRGERGGLAKLTDSQVLEIRKLARSGLSHRKLAENFNCNHRTIGRILTKETWSHLPDPEQST